MSSTPKSSARRTLIRENRPDTSAVRWDWHRCNGTFPSLLIAAGFWILATTILMLREDVLPYRPGQTIRYDVISRVDFAVPDEGLLTERQGEARRKTPRVYQATTADRAAGDVWQPLQDELAGLPDAVLGLTWNQLPPRLKDVLDYAALSALQQYHGRTGRADYAAAVNGYLSDLRKLGTVVLPADQRQQELRMHHGITLLPESRPIEAEQTLAYPADDDTKARLGQMIGERFRLALQPTIMKMTLPVIRPTHALHEDLTELARNNAAESIDQVMLQFHRNQPIVHKGLIQTYEWQLLRAENAAFLATLGKAGWKQRLGVAGVALLLTMTLAAYSAHFHPKIVRNHTRGIAICALLLSMLLLAQLAGLGPGPIYLFAVAPTLLVGIILTIAYEQRFAVGVASIHAMLVTVGLDQRIGFLLTIWVGIICTCFLLNDIRSRSKLVEVGGVAAIVMMLATAAWGMISLDPWRYIANNCLYAGAAGLSVGFVVLGILPFVEKSFRITTTMTLLELADASQPLLRRLAVEAPGTYSHSLQVATLAESAAEAIGANALLCRVAAYYHDVGKINKAEYFVENQQGGQCSRHLNLTPSVSFLIIKGHVADGLALAGEYNLPASVLPFIEQHHGSTLVEYFYHAARKQQEQRGDEVTIHDTDFRYPGPKPRSKEVGILMLADAAESATRAMTEPTSGRIESLVHDLTMKRLLDGQFDDCELTLRDLDRIERSLTKTLLSLYHGRIAYPSTAALTHAPAGAAVRLA